jgi:hypothetical protein
MAPPLHNGPSLAFGPNGERAAIANRFPQRTGLADLERAQRLICKHPAPIDPQFRIASAEAIVDRRHAYGEREGKSPTPALVSDFMVRKHSPGFILESELHEPDAVLSVVGFDGVAVSDAEKATLAEIRTALGR